MPPKQKAKIVKDVTQLVLARRTRMCNFLEYKGLFLFLLVMNLSMIAGLARFEGRLSAICVSILRDRNWPDGQ
jgi:AP-1 complex subunit sigma 1/2